MHKKGIQSPIQTQIETINIQLLFNVNRLNKAIWKLNKTLKGVLLDEITFQKV